MPTKNTGRHNMTSLDAIDRRILIELQREGRLTNQDLADRVGLSPTACLRRMRRLEQIGVLSRYVALVDAAQVGLEITAFTRVSLERQDATLIDQFERTVAAWPEVLECYLMTGEADYQLKVVAAGLGGYEAFLREKLTRTPGVAKIHSSLAFRPIVNRTALPL
ncbi:MAG TPA: Lrp/AsnC family transcriptional regulator [Phenylobacterium sp.]|nr:Lrp/AsnC family transcriptional regulator [Phenylobacterium sp.]